MSQNFSTTTLPDPNKPSTTMTEEPDEPKIDLDKCPDLVLLLVFDVIELNKLIPLRILNRRFNALVLSKLASQTELTIEVTPEKIDENKFRLWGANEQNFRPYLFNVDDTALAAVKLLDNPQITTGVVDPVGKVIHLNSQHTESFCAIADDWFSQVSRLSLRMKPELRSTPKAIEALSKMVILFQSLKHLSINWTLPREWLPYKKEIGNVFTALNTRVNSPLECLDLYFIGLRDFTFCLNYNLAPLMPQLTRLSINDSANNVVDLLSNASKKLEYLKLNCNHMNLRKDDFQVLLTKVNPSLRTSITELALRSYHWPLITIVADHFIHLKSLKLMTCRDASIEELTLDKIQKLRKLRTLEELTLIDYHLEPIEIGANTTLPSITKLTMYHIRLFDKFRYQRDSEEPEMKPINVNDVSNVLLGVFCNVKEMTLAGKVYQSQRVRNLLEDKLNSIQLKMIFIDRDPNVFDCARGLGPPTKDEIIAKCQRQPMVINRANIADDSSDEDDDEDADDDDDEDTDDDEETDDDDDDEDWTPSKKPKPGPSKRKKPKQN